MSRFLAFVLLFFGVQSFSQNPGLIVGQVIDSMEGRPLAGATINLVGSDRSNSFETITDKTGAFAFQNLPFNIYRLTISYTGFANHSIDSIKVRRDRFEFNLGEVYLFNKASSLQTVTVYAEKPLIESREGNITFNAGESPLSAGSTAAELLNNVPLVTKDPNGKILVRGKEPRILIDDKPVELNLQQLQDMLESMPGSSIEKIEVMTNPPPQYANEQGGVINIVTKKGKAGIGGRLGISGGTRGEGSLNGNFHYRKNKFSLNATAGAGLTGFSGYGNSFRKNIYPDSVNYFRTTNNYITRSFRPNFRFTTDYEFSERQSFNVVLNVNQNDFDNESETEYTNINNMDQVYRLSERMIESKGNNRNSNLNITYTRKGRRAGESIRIIGGGNISHNENNRSFYQQYFNPDHSPNGLDSTQNQLTDTRINGISIRISVDRPLVDKKTFLSTGASYSRSNNHVVVNAGYLRKPDGAYVISDLLSNDFYFHQGIANFRGSLKQLIGQSLSFTAGVAAEQTGIHFELIKDSKSLRHDYWSFLPFANLSKNWKEKLNLTFSYRRTIRRPGLNELNPSIDFSDPYNVRFGNYQLSPSLAHNFDLVAGRTKTKYYLNLGVGYNEVKDIFSQVRSLLSDGKTQLTWENISNRREYEISTWNGYTFSKKLKANVSSSFTYNMYSDYDKSVRKFRNGGSFTTTINGTYVGSDTWNLTGSTTMNRFANPQGAVNWHLSTNLGMQKKFFRKKLITTLNIIDLFREQQTSSYTYGTNFELNSSSYTGTRNFRLSLAYVFLKK